MLLEPRHHRAILAVGTQPLYVVDGVFVDNTATSAGLNAVTNAAAGGAVTSNQDNPSSRIADIRAEDIDNIEILKGASAAAVSGITVRFVNPFADDSGAL